MTADRGDSEAVEGGHPVDVDELAARLSADGEPFARVTVVRREPPVSATVGDRAIVTADGELHGWIGGAACAQSIAIREAERAMDRGEPTMVGVAPDPDDVDRPGLESFPMSCHSEGVLEFFIEPIGTAPGLVIAGDSPTAHTLSQFAAELAFDVTAISGAPSVPGDEGPIPPEDVEAVGEAIARAEYVVIASMGEIDELVLVAALRAGPPYLGLVASDDRASAMIDRVAERLDRDPADVAAAVVQPAGANIGAKTSEEIAVSVLAELIALERDGPMAPSLESDLSVESVPEPAATSGATDAEVAVDPVCGMDVRVGEEAATVEHGGEIYRFCATGCAEAFEADPDRFLEAEPEAP